MGFSFMDQRKEKNKITWGPKFIEVGKSDQYGEKDIIEVKYEDGEWRMDGKTVNFEEIKEAMEGPAFYAALKDSIFKNLAEKEKRREN